MFEAIREDIPRQAKETSIPFAYPNKRHLSGSSPKDTRSVVPFQRPTETDRIVELLVNGVPDVLAKQAKRVAEEIVPLYLEALSGPVEISDECRTRLRLSGEAWSATGLALEDLLSYFSDFASGVTDALLTRAQPTPGLPVSNILGLTNQVTREFFIGVSRARMTRPPRVAAGEPRNPAADLLAGKRLPAEATLRLAAKYLIVLVRHTPNPADTRLVRKMRTVGGDGTFVLPGGTETVALIPARDSGHNQRLTEDLNRLLGGQDWGAVAERDRTAIPDGYREAADILDLVRASQRAPQVYRLDDVLLEYAALRDTDVSHTLSAILEPLLAHSMLYETLAALVRADFNRNATAKSLFIHRSTMDYRLDRIRELTGHDPMSSLGIQIFSTAIALHTTTTRDSPARPNRQSVHAR